MSGTSMLSHMNAFGVPTETEPCLGAAHMAMHAMLAKKMPEYDRRNTKLRDTAASELKGQVEKAEKKRLDKEALTEEEEFLVQIPEHLQAVKLSQEAYKHRELFLPERGTLKQDATPALELVASVPISSQKTVFSGCYTQEDLEIYCATLEEHIVGFQKPCSLVLIGGGHAITLGYDIATNEWLVADSFPSPTERIRGNADVAMRIRAAFSTNKVAAFSTTTHTLKEHEQEWQNTVDAWSRHPSMQRIHTVNKEKAARKDSSGATWLYVAAQCSDEKTAQTLLMEGANPDQKFKDRSTPLFVSVQNRDTRMTRLLENYGANPALPSMDNKTPEQLKANPKIHHIVGYFTAEHEEIGNAAKTPGVNGSPLAELDVYRVDGTTLTEAHNELPHVTFSELVAMPDYFELRVGAISDYTNPQETEEQRINLFTKAFNQLVRHKHLEETVGDVDEVTRIPNTNEYGQVALDVACCGARYLKLIEQNFDHFAPDAWFAYKAGHQKALEMAQKAYQLRDNPEEATKYLETAYAMGAFACHFVSDNLSAGHIRTPRRKLVEQFGSFIGGALSNNIHDEDCANGIWVKNAKDDTWKCFGDGNLNKEENKKTKEIVMEIVRNSADEIYRAFQTGVIPAPDQFMAKNLLPKSLDDLSTDLEKPYQLNVAEQLSSQMPLFIERDGKIHVRRELKDRTCIDYKELTMLQAIIAAARLRIGKSSAPQLHPDKDPTLPEEPSIEDLTILKDNVLRIVNQFCHYSPVKAFFEAVRDSRNAALRFKQTIEQSSPEDIPEKLHEFFTSNRKSTQLERQLAVPIQMFAERLGHTETNIQTRADVLGYLAEQLGMSPPPIEEPERSKTCGCF